MNNEEDTYHDVLPRGFDIHWYTVESVLGRGAFGVTYLALDKNLDQYVAIKEYFPNEFSTRESGYTVQPITSKNKKMYEWGLSRFIREARILARFKHPNIVRVLSVFENNNTAYMVMEYENGNELSRVLREKESFTEQELLDIFLPVMEGLTLIHNAGFIHRDIKPSNIYIREDGTPVLIDFGSARQITGSSTRALTSLVTYGYAPFEQYNESEDKQGPWTDIYALGASLFFSLTKQTPVEALARGASILSSDADPYQLLSVTLAGKYSASFLRAIDHALLFHAKERPQDVMVWASMLKGKKKVPELTAVMSKNVPETKRQDATVVRNGKPGASVPVTSQPAKPMINIRLVSMLLGGVVILVAGVILMPGAGEEAEKGEPPATPKQEAAININVLLAQANQAYLAEHYIKPDNNNALQFYLQLLRLEPAHKQASFGVEKIIQYFDDNIRNDIADDHFDEAEENLRLLLVAIPDSEKLIKLRNELETAQAVYSRRLQLLARADELLKQKNFLSPEGDNALSTLHQVLELDSGNEDALQRIAIISADYVQQVKKDITAGKFSSAQKNILNIKRVDNAHPEIVSLNRLLVNAKKEKKQKTLNRFLRLAKEAIKENRLVDPPQKNALYFYQKTLDLDAGNTKAKNGIKVVKKRLEEKLSDYLEQYNHSKTESLVILIEKLFSGSAFAKNSRVRWNNNISSPESDRRSIEEMIGNFKKALELRNQRTLDRMSEYKPNRKDFVGQLFSHYRSFRLEFLNVKIIAQKSAGQASVKITKLINMQGQPVQPGAWSNIEIDIKRNRAGQWKIYW